MCPLVKGEQVAGYVSSVGGVFRSDKCLSGSAPRHPPSQISATTPPASVNPATLDKLQQKNNGSNQNRIAPRDTTGCFNSITIKTPVDFFPQISFFFRKKLDNPCGPWYIQGDNVSDGHGIIRLSARKRRAYNTISSGVSVTNTGVFCFVRKSPDSKGNPSVSLGANCRTETRSVEPIQNSQPPPPFRGCQRV